MVKVTIYYTHNNNNPCVYVCTWRAAMELYFMLTSSNTNLKILKSIQVSSIDGSAKLELNEYGQPRDGQYAFINLASACFGGY